VAELKIPFNRPALMGLEKEYLDQAMAAGHLSGDGEFTKRCNEILSGLLGGGRVLLTTSCTHALEMAALLLKIEPGDEVIMSSFTFVSTANPFVLRGAHPVFVDCRPDTLNLDERLVEARITKNTKAMVPVHYAGVACEMDTLMGLAGERGIAVVEDNAHGLMGSYKGRPLGSFGVLSAQSFHGTKNFTCGEGGALAINDPDLFEPAEIIREKGTNRSQFFRGQVDKYGWIEAGSSYLPSELLAAFLLAQLEAREEIQANRKMVWDYYYRNLADWASATGTQLPLVPVGCVQPYHLFHLLMPSLKKRQELIGRLKEKGIGAAFHYLPLHSSSKGLSLGYQKGDCPVTEDISDRLVRLPFFNTLTQEELALVVEAVTSLD
jgi:dTDP-4-amino-4,6-dideoxygalactose transaminase